ncbi:PLP-dependent aminotransferase family protein [Rhodospirillaceae bacterium SYSU D60014]|uniref:MocR-like pyridoxine biosynthesis transcription factor PdxR n=1 Tax=Virgifigura deserti TaxID=2268457 RepID=UPI000E664184
MGALRRRRDGRTPLLSLHLDSAAAMPLHRQLYAEIRDMILQGRLAPGLRLPSSRTLSQDLRISRNTVLLGLEQLWSEGYVEGRTGAGTFVSQTLPDGLLAARTTMRPVGDPLGGRGDGKRQGPGPSERGLRLAAGPARRLRPAPAFAPGLPDCSDFPFDLWARLLAKAWRRPPPHLFAAADSAGYRPLRAAIADYLRVVRAVRCEAEQVIVLSGIRQAVDLVARVLLDPDDIAWMEEPGYPGIRAALSAAGARIRAMPVDAEGLCLDDGGTESAARLVCVAPSHQYPLGVTMSLPRRLDLLDWARRADAWILEDDYDSEFRYAGRPLSALQGLDADGRVLYAGSFSKVLFPSLRIGYLIVPPPLVETFRRARAALDDHASTTAQPALAEFMAAGHFAAHVRRMRKRYETRQQALLAAARHLRGLLTLAPDPAGMHLVADLGPDLAGRVTDRAASAAAGAAGLVAPPLSDYFAGPPMRQGLLLGYAAVPETEMEPAVRRLAAALGAL